ncbi:GNAT family N-acetyltransferase [Synoicihabitans lomoniglobus]|uniref:GNAT family N-acetyltransferase n=1 Tax=Synoicihabitans lomoniglobus TaxID=2909285 RepID=A0AAE9ZWJ5_9BACT|nr:GNAT family N-acetyltransferase [Opitutaceae bacterium LMO-M01]WED64195.1 GNAT family N-acetyltransferase [Opitutaceae bacterium LMO-M01]
MRLRSTPFDPEQFAVWREHSIAAFAADKIAAGTWSADQAPALAVASFDESLPQGSDTTGHAIRRVINDATEELIGWFWVGPATHSAPGTAWLFDIEIVPEHRGQGHGRAVLKLAEDEARTLGFSTLGLHVFAHNPVARHLYEACDFQLTDLNYAKKL